MPISAKDKEFMDQVTEYFLSTKTPQEPNGSIRDTAIRYNISRNKVRKILITTGELESPITENAVRMRSQGLSIKEIAETLDVSVDTVATDTSRLQRLSMYLWPQYPQRYHMKTRWIIP